MALLDEENAAFGAAPESNADTVDKEQAVTQSVPGQPVRLPGGGFLGDLPPGVGTRASPFAPQIPPPQPSALPPEMTPAATQPPPFVPPGQPMMAPPVAPRPARAGGPAPQNAEARAQADEQKAFGAQADAKSAEGPANQAIEDQRAAGLEEKAAAQAQQAKDYEAQQKIAAQAHANAVAEAQSAADEYKNYKFQDFWAKGRNDVPLRSTASRIVTIVGAFLGGYANPGGPNAVLDMIKRETERDFDKQKIQLQSKENIATLKRQGVKDVDEFQKDQLARLQIKQGMALQAVADHIDAMTATATGKLRAAEGKTAADAIRTQGAAAAATGQHQLVDSQLKRSEMSKNYAEAGKANAEAKAAGTKAVPGDDEIYYDKNGQAVGLVVKGRGGAQAFTTRDVNLQDADEKIQKYRNFLAGLKDGRPSSMAEIKRAKVLYESAGLAVGAVSPNGTTKEAQEAEKATLGPDPSSPLGWAQGGSLQAVDDKLAQVRQIHQDYRTQMLRPLPGRLVGGQSAQPQPNREDGMGAAAQPAGDPAGSVRIMVKNKKTGQLMPAMQLSDGRIVAP